MKAILKDMFNRLRIALIACILAMTCGPAGSATLDSSFGVGGKVLTDFSQGNSFLSVRQILEQSDGKIIAIGNASYHFALMRFNTNGTVDSSFGKNGKVVLHLHDRDVAGPATFDLNGNIVITGYSNQTYSSAEPYLLVARVKPDGTLDRTFSGDGWTMTNFGPYSFAWPRSVTVDASNRILVTGTSTTYHSGAFVVRYRANGSLDPAFDGDGKRMVLFGSDPNEHTACNDVAVDSRGRILLAGAKSGDLVTARLNPNGSFDTSFGGTGFVVELAVKATIGSQVAELSDGRIAITGEGYGWPQLLIQTRYFANGSRQRTFGSDGYTQATLGEFPNTRDYYSVVIAPNGSVTFAAVARDFDTNPPQSFRIRIGRLSSTGAFYSNFGGDGKVELLQPAEPYAVSAFAVQRNGSVLVGSGFSLTRTLSNGEIDLRWNGGIVTGNEGSDDKILEMAVDSKGRIVVVGTAFQYPVANSSVLARYLPNGALDPAFGQGGRVLSSSPDFIPSRKLLLDANGRILAVGTVRIDGLDRLAMARFNDNGSPDTSFGQGGRIVYSILGTTNSNPYGLACVGAGIRSDGKIAVGLRGALARFNSNGSPDTLFGDGSFAPGFKRIEAINLANDMVLDSAGRFLLTLSAGYDFTVVRCTANGNLDPSFGSGGTARLDLGQQEESWTLAIASGGKILVGGYSEPSPNQVASRYARAAAALVRLNDNGSLDTSFHGDGKLLISNTQARAFNKLVVDGLGRTWAAMSAGNDFKIARLLADGRLDSTFGEGGFFSIDFGGSDYANTLALDTAGRAVVGGYSDLNGDNDFALARLDDTPQLMVSGISASEGNAGTVNLRFIVKLTTPSLNTVTVNFATADGSATAGSDYAAKSGRLTFRPGETEKRLAVVVNGDTAVEDDETVFLNLSNAVNATLREAEGIGSIVNDDR